MLLSDLLLEFEFNCQVRKLSPRTIGNYKKQIQYLLNFLEQEYSVTVLEEVELTMIKTLPCHYDQFRQEAQLCKRPSESV